MVNLELVRDLAYRAHKGQQYGEKPYSYHLEMVVQNLRDVHCTDSLTLAVGYCHDLYEQGYTAVQREFEATQPADLLMGVRFCTDEVGKNRKERKQATYAKWRAHIDQWRRAGSPMDYWLSSAILAKVADRNANVKESILTNKRDLWAMYVSEDHDFRTALFVPGLNPSLWETYRHLISID